MATCGTSNNYPSTECTHWANNRYHQLTGCFVPWSDDAHGWKLRASQAGWTVTSTPVVGSIMCLQGGVQGASLLGHVGIVESINKNGSFITSNLNWQPRPRQIMSVKHTSGPGVSFLYNPTKTHPQAGKQPSTTTFARGACKDTTTAPGTHDPCLNCGKPGSAAYNQCHAALAAKVGSVPPCAKPCIAQNQKEVSDAVKTAASTAASGLSIDVSIFKPANDFFAHLNALMSNPVRLIKGFLGVLMIAAGLYLLVQIMVPGQIKTAVKTVAKVAAL